MDRCCSVNQLSALLKNQTLTWFIPEWIHVFEHIGWAQYKDSLIKTVKCVLSVRVFEQIGLEWFNDLLIEIIKCGSSLIKKVKNSQV